MVFHGKWYDEVKVGDSFGTSLTVTETHLVLGSGMFGDFNPLHVDEEFSKKSMFGGRILHGPFTSALVAAPVGNFFAGQMAAFYEEMPLAQLFGMVSILPLVSGIVMLLCARKIMTMMAGIR